MNNIFEFETQRFTRSATDHEVVELEIVSSIGEYGYEFDVFTLWRDKATGEFYCAHDMGCSCTYPYMSDTLADFTPVRSTGDLLTAFKKAETYASEADFGSMVGRYREVRDGAQ